jgi:hypothetical protein
MAKNRNVPALVVRSPILGLVHPASVGITHVTVSPKLLVINDAPKGRKSTTFQDHWVDFPNGREITEFPDAPNGRKPTSPKMHGHCAGTGWAQIGHKTKKAHRSEPLLSWKPTYILVAEARFELTTGYEPIFATMFLYRVSCAHSI